MTCTAKRFLHDIRDHKMTIKQDDGLYRHLIFSRPQSSIYQFSLITWPGYLAIAGDCDDFMFTRISDMFDFFRFAGPEYNRSDGINTGYWAEKAVAVSKTSELWSFSEDLFEEAIRSKLNEWISGWVLSDAKEIVRKVKEVLLSGFDNKQEAITAAMDFRCPVTGNYVFQDFYEHRLDEPSFGYSWACYAIQWGIKQYDLHHQGRTQADHDKKVLAGII